MSSLVCLLLCGAFFTCASAMETAIDTEATGTLTVSYAYGTDADLENNLVLPGVSFRLYRVAAVDEKGIWSLIGAFADCGVTNEQLNSLEHAQDINAVVNTLAFWITEKELKPDEENRDHEKETESQNTENAQPMQNNMELENNIQPESPQTDIRAAQEVLTNEAGVAVFENLQTGLYLLTSDSLTDKNMVYSNSPSLVSIPSVSSAGTGWEYEITVNAKAEAVSLSQDPQPDTDEPPEEPTETETEPSTGAMTESSGETSPEPSTEPATEPETSPTTGSTSETTITESPNETMTEPSTEAITEHQTAAAAEPQTESVSEQSTDTSIDMSTGAYFEPAAELSSDIRFVTEYSTEVVSSTEIVTDVKIESWAESETTDAVQTGDDTPVMEWLVLLCTAFGILAAGMWRRRQNE